MRAGATVEAPGAGVTPGETAPDGMVCERFEDVDVYDTPRLELPPGGGFMLRLEPERNRKP